MSTPEQRRQYNKTYYAKTKQIHNPARYERRERLRKEVVAWFKEYKKTLSCVRCGFNHPAALDFHHREPAEKEHLIAGMVGSGKTKARILLEIAKCDVLCANCHRIEHWKE